MARVISKKRRQFILSIGDALEQGIIPDSIELFREDGTPAEIGSDSARMRWLRLWSSTVPYVKNDVVEHNGKPYIAIVDSIASGATTPSDESLPGENVTVPSAGGTAYSVGKISATVGERIYASNNGAGRWFYFDLVTGGTVTLRDLLMTSAYKRLHNSVGTQIAVTPQTDPFADTLVATGLASGRYYFWAQQGHSYSPDICRSSEANIDQKQDLSLQACRQMDQFGELQQSGFQPSCEASYMPKS